jgi:hypothetical protein
VLWSNENWEFAWVFPTLMSRSNENKSCMWVDWILPRARGENSFEPIQSWWELMRVGAQTWVALLSCSFDRGFIFRWLKYKRSWKCFLMHCRGPAMKIRCNRVVQVIWTHFCCCQPRTMLPSSSSDMCESYLYTGLFYQFLYFIP